MREAIENAILILESEKVSEPTKIALVWATLKTALKKEVNSERGKTTTAAAE